MASSTADLPGGGAAPLLTLRTASPLPRFRIPHGVPNEDTSISSFKLSILRILTGQTVSSSSTKPLTFSEELKEKTIQGWRMEMLMLELRQGANLDPAAAAVAEDDTSDSEITGFELLDDHDCSLLEEGDEIVVRIKAGHELKDLQLPELGSRHKYSAPAGSLTRAGTLSEPPPYSVAMPAEPSSHSSSVAAQPNANYHQHSYHDYRQGFRVLTANNVGGGRVRRTSASPNPNANTGGYGLGPAGLGGGLNLVGTATRPTNGARKSSGKRDRPSGQVKPVHRRIASSSAAMTAEATPPASPLLASPPTSPNPGAVSAANGGQQRSAISRRNSATVMSQSQQQSQQQQHQQHQQEQQPQQQQQHSSSSATTVAFGSGKVAGQMSMPLTALVIGPGVQGAVGRTSGSAANPIGSAGGAAIEGEDYGNASAFVGFTAASGEVRPRPKKHVTRQRSDDGAGSDGAPAGTVASTGTTTVSGRPSNPASAAADAAERRAAIAKAQQAAANGDSGGGRPARERRASSSSHHLDRAQQQRPTRVELPTAPTLPPIQNLAPFPNTPGAYVPEERKERDLPPMPSATAASSPGPVVSRNYLSEASQLSPLNGPNVQRPGQVSFFRRFSSRSQAAQSSSSPVTTPSATNPGAGTNPTSPMREQLEALALSSQLVAEELEGNETGTPGGAPNPTAKLSKAERRYAEIQQGLARERERQAEAERVRRDEIRLADEKKAKEAERKEAEYRQKEEERKWAIWEEVRKRQNAGSPSVMPPPQAVAAPNLKRRKSSMALLPTVVPASAGDHEKGEVHAPLSAPVATAAFKATDANGQASSSRRPSAAAGSAAPPASGSGGVAGNSSGSSSLPGAGIELGLERVTALLTRLGSPHLRFPVIHVAGTNGKGSTIAFLDSILRNALDIRTGTFVSPHLVERRDSCKVDGAVIPRDVWRLAQADVLEADQGLELSPERKGPNDDGGPLQASPFELLTAQTFQAFATLPEAQRPELLLIEVGLGGRLDATNVFEPGQVLASVICPIAKDHEALLGSELTGIAREKAGIVKQGGLCVVADQRGAVDSDEADSAPNAQEIADQTALGPLANETAVLGSRVAGILDAVRNVCIDRGAKLVRASVPLSLLSYTASTNPADRLPVTRRGGREWGATTTFRPLLGPTLSLSTSGFNPPRTFVAHPGDPPVTGPLLTVERTRANVLGCATAVQTLWSIARDDPTLEGRRDRWEDLRTRIVWGLRDEDLARLRVQNAVEETTWDGRCQWIDLGDLPIDAGAGAGTTSEAGVLLVDGAHNPASALALREYIDACLTHPSTGVKEGQEVSLTYLLSFSAGKDWDRMLHTLLTPSTAPDQTPHPKRTNIALLPFSTPVEGMPWVHPLPIDATIVAATKRILAQHGLDATVETFPNLTQALQWTRLLSPTTSGKAAQNRERHLPVLCGSLYLVGDLYSLLRQAK